MFYHILALCLHAYHAPLVKSAIYSSTKGSLTYKLCLLIIAIMESLVTDRAIAISFNIMHLCKPHVLTKGENPNPQSPQNLMSLTFK